MSSIESIISFLVSRKFGFSATLAPALASFDKTQNNENSKIVAQIEEYKRTLRNVQSNELLTLYNEELAKEERERFYNQRYAYADFVHWAKAAHWTIDEAVALSFGKEPSVVTWKEIEKLTRVTAFAKSFAKRRDLALRAVVSQKLSEKFPPPAFISWAQDLSIELPNALIEEVAKIAGAAINWHEKYLELKNAYDVLAAQSNNAAKPESTRKSNNVLQAFTAIAIDAYGYNPKAEKSKAPQDIADALTKLGAVGNPKTIRGWLKEGAELLPANPYKD